MIYFFFQKGETRIEHWIVGLCADKVFARIESDKNEFLITNACWRIRLIFYNLDTQCRIINTNTVVYTGRPKPQGRRMRKSVKIAMNKFVDCYFFGFTSGLNCEGVILKNPDITIGAISFEIFRPGFRGASISSTSCVRQILFVSVGMDRTIGTTNLRPRPTVLIFTKRRHICPKDIKVRT
jgi:hypothetical protein